MKFPYLLHTVVMHHFGTEISVPLVYHCSASFGYWNFCTSCISLFCIVWVLKFLYLLYIIVVHRLGTEISVPLVHYCSALFGYWNFCTSMVTCVGLYARWSVNYVSLLLFRHCSDCSGQFQSSLKSEKKRLKEIKKI